MNITNAEVINILNILDDYSDKKLPQKISYAITRNLMLLKKDYECYISELNKLFHKYDNHIVRDEANARIMFNDEGIPIIDEEMSHDFQNELNSLLNIEINTELYTVSFDTFDYNDERYDALAAKDILTLQSVLCT